MNMFLDGDAVTGSLARCEAAGTEGTLAAEIWVLGWAQDRSCSPRRFQINCNVEMPPLPHRLIAGLFDADPDPGRCDATGLITTCI